MPEADPLDLAALLAPIPGPCPAGTDVRYTGDHDQIREARRADDPSLPQGVWRFEPKRADWAAVEALAAETLARRSKDLQVAVWLAEALVHRRGFAGIAPAIGLLRQLCAQHWQQLYPELEPDDSSARVAPLAWLNDRLPGVLREVPVTAGPEERPYSVADHERARRLESVRSRDPKAAERAEANGAIALAAVEAELSATPDGELRAILAAVEAGAAELKALERLLDRLLGRDAPGLGAVREALQEIGGLLATALRNRPNRFVDAARRLVGGPARPSTPKASLPLEAGSATGSLALPPLASRDEAYQRLSQVAEFLAQNEPHSPVVPLLERALEWGAMPLDQLLRVLAGDQRAAPALFDLLGLTEVEPRIEPHEREMLVENSTLS